MKTLLLMRHAKSSWDNPDLDDFDRPLNNRGRRDAPFMGALLREQGILPDVITSSPAVRAFSTARAVAGALSYAENRITTDTRLYDASASEILAVVGEWSNAAGAVLLVAHNPGLTHAVNMITGAGLDNVPTSGIAVIDFDVKSWNATGQAKGRLRLFEYPKKYRDG